MARLTTALATLLIGSAVANASEASARPIVTLALRGSVPTAAGDRPLDAAPPQPGQIIHYVITATNAGSDPAANFRSVALVPAGTRFVARSASGAGANVEYSLDGGKHWSAHPTVRVTAPDGTTSVRNADPATYDAIRFDATAPLGAKRSESFAYDVRVI